jgi:threonine dehydratase
VDDLLLVDEGDIEQAVLMLLEIEKPWSKARAPPAWPRCCATRALRGKKVGLVLSGGNIDPLLLAAIIERGMVRSGGWRASGQRARRARRAGAHHRHRGRGRRQHRGGAPPARLHHAGGAERGDRLVLQTRGKAHVEQVLDQLRAAWKPSCAASADTG